VRLNHLKQRNLPPNINMANFAKTTQQKAPVSTDQGFFIFIQTVFKSRGFLQYT
jgi:hypothetical protein